MTDAPHSHGFLRRALGAIALCLVGVPMIVIGMLMVFSIVAVDTIERRLRGIHPAKAIG
jgi:hypothetical protein